ncbi:N-UTILIZATION SUBSTANCE PROTEIN A [Mycoplasmopsis pulmonis]|uniref:N-UTILIZATION SUBSTANCE PROTEIN A n=1 Tax=Mycoplasmopsis pulmonis (strain UAB CTIP) TaxID=272635 RepID=Q98R07_MYCPU|nr:transcription termination/antitermination protein NusA [Mycoplasmopsis pulmonis]CAC13376.1 N-UTILIZATION SUBSTANCE PROTEIN A [Mycoplasmopsis pulmonis]VEU67966.1 Transcription elongation protein nusA [Mycoplasmopsis pulmonis]
MLENQSQNPELKISSKKARSLLKSNKTIDFFLSLENLSRDKKLKISTVKQIFQEAFFQVIKNDFDPDADLEIVYDDEKKEVTFYNNNAIVIEDALEEADDDYSAEEMLVSFVRLSDARKEKSDVQIGDIVKKQIKHDELKLNEVKKIFSIFQQNLAKEAKQSVLDFYSSKIGQKIQVKIEEFKNRGFFGSVVGDMETKVFLPNKEINKNSKIALGKKIDVYFIEFAKEFQNKSETLLIVSLNSPLEVINVLKETFEEIANGSIIIKKIARKAGIRTKIAVEKSHLASEGLNIIGTLIGQSGDRNKIISEKLNNEKIDFVIYKEDLQEFIVESLKPANVISIERVVPETHIPAFNVVVPNSQMSVAIGKAGMNTILSSELSQSRINIETLDKAKEKGWSILWNGNVKEHELEEIEKHSWQNKKVISQFSTRRSKARRQNDFSNYANDFGKGFNIDEFKKDFEDFEAYFEENNLVASDEMDTSLDMAINDFEAPKLEKTSQEQESESQESQEKAQSNNKQINRLKNYVINDKDFSDFALDGIDLDDFDDSEW